MNTDYDSLLTDIDDTDIEKALHTKNKVNIGNTPSSVPISPSQTTVFDQNIFIQNLKSKSITNTKKRLDNSNQNIGAYDLVGCILKPFHRMNHVVPDQYESSFLPVELSSIIGDAIHKFIQSNYKFSDLELSMNIPSISVSSRLDATIGNDCLIEIKTCGYKDYYNILNSEVCRKKDFIQLCVYKYLLENYISEIRESCIRNNQKAPMFPSYNIQKFQIIYVCHEIVDSSGNIDVYNDIKKYYTNQYGDFWFMKVINIDLNVEKTSLFANKILEDIPKKIKYLNDAKKNSIPITLGNEFVEKTECKFCQYRNTCYKFL